MTDPELFVTVCTLHQTVPMQCHTNHMKKPFVKPTAANAFFMHVELDLRLYLITGLHILTVHNFTHDKHAYAKKWRFLF